MSLLDLVPGVSLLRIGVALACVIGVAGGAWKIHHSIDKAGYDRAMQEVAWEQLAQADRNRATGRAAELSFHTKTAEREKIVIHTIKELQIETKYLDSCALGTGIVAIRGERGSYNVRGNCCCLA